MPLLVQALTYHRYSDEPLSVLVVLLIRIALVVATGWLVSRGLSRSSAAVQHRVWLLTILGTLTVPLAWALTPGWRVPLLALEVVGATVPPDLGAATHSAGSVWPQLLVAGWIVGTLLGLGYTALGFVTARRLFRGSGPCRHRGWLESLAEVRDEMQLKRPVELRVTRRSVSPAVWSFRRVQILLPADCLAWPASVRRSVLVHELAHVARGDCTSQMIANLACAVWWFHPLVWYAAARVRAFGEQAADDHVIRSSGRPTDYAHELLAIAASLGWSRLPSPAQTMFHPSHLERRLRAILDPLRRRNPLSPGRSLAGIFMASVLMIPLVTLTTSVVRAVGSPVVPQSQPVSVDVHLKVRVTVPVIPIQFPPGDYRPHFVPPNPGAPWPPFDPSQPSPPIDVPPPAAQLLPNWEVGRNAEMLIPNYEQGMARVVFVQQPPPQPAASTAVVPTSIAYAAPGALPAASEGGISYAPAAPAVAVAPTAIPPGE
jgi:beta-lactamase regulating signal transducer with metallopeptidase domain